MPPWQQKDATSCTEAKKLCVNKNHGVVKNSFYDSLIKMHARYYTVHVRTCILVVD